MLRIEIRFPLGVYYALSAESFGRAEWPPSPVRLVGALLAAAHESDAVQTEAAREVLLAICEADPPELKAPLPESPTNQVSGHPTVAEFRSASRWAPRSRESSEIKKKGMSFRKLSGDQTEVFKSGTVVGDHKIEVRWPELRLGAQHLEVLRIMSQEVTFLGTSRSPVILSIGTDDPSGADAVPRWRAVPELAFEATEVRVPNPRLLREFDRRHEARRSTGRTAVQNSGHVQNVAMGTTMPYLTVDRIESLLEEIPLGQSHWGDMLMLELDMSESRGGRKSELWPHASASYLVARAFRSALLGTYGPAGSPDEAPGILCGHGSEPHVALIPLPHVGVVASRVVSDSEPKLIPADGLIRGLAVILPHESRVPDVLEQRLLVEDGLRRFVLGDERRSIDLPGAGRLWLRLSPPGRTPMKTLQEPLYRGPSRVWETVTPVIHARRRTSTGPRGVARQIAADCSFAGLPEPVQVEVLKNAPFAGAPDRPLSSQAVPPAWRASMTGPHSHLRLTFDQPIEGPVLLGKASHFGLGLCRPAASPGNHSDPATPIVAGVAS
ncbi:MAG TPA: type I-U CRISPR-associated protein Csb2 [Solirubrobacterales bacterium]|nr:type I-U CRISPR-associated protein Csb2 [Solirubrobacterales bacterium]